MAHGILVPLDGSELAARAVPYAAMLAERCRAEVLLVEAVAPTPHPTETYAHARERSFAEAEARLDGFRLDLEPRGLAVRRIVQEGDPARVLLDAAREWEATLVVMATHGRSGPSRWVVGSVAERVLQGTHLPVFLLTPRALDAGTPERLAGRVVVPVDGSELSERIFPAVEILARRLHDPVTLVEAIDPDQLNVAGTPYSSALLALPDLAQAAEDAARKRLGERAGQWTHGGIPTVAVVERGVPEEAIARVVERERAGWLAMASHGRGGWGGLVLGSTALAVVRHTTLPVLLAAMPRLDGYRIGAQADQAARGRVEMRVSRRGAARFTERTSDMAAIFGAFKTEETANRAVDDLIAGGYAPDRISVHTQRGVVPDIAVDLADENRDTDEAAAPAADTSRTIGLTAVGALAGGSGLTAGRETSSGLGGALLGYLVSAGATPHEALHYADRVHTHGDYVVAVRIPPGDEIHAEEILALAGAETPIRRTA